MPKTEAEKHTLKRFKKEYGNKKGEQYYFSLRNKSKKFDRSQGGGRASSKAAWWAMRLNAMPEPYKTKLIKALGLVVKSDLEPKYEMDVNGLQVAIEYEPGDIKITRSGRAMVIHYPYGFIKSSKGLDGDSVDCFVGPERNAGFVYLMRQIDPNTSNLIEVKSMLNFPSGTAATEAYKLHYDNPVFFGGMRSFEFAAFKSMVAASLNNPSLLKAKLID